MAKASKDLTGKTRRVRAGISRETPPKEALGQTRASLLVAAETCLRAGGYAALSTRAVAECAQVPLSQLHYHFGSKLGLVLALFESLNERLLQRQARLFQENTPLWRQWEIACDFLDEDLASGYVRVLHELSAASWSDADIARHVQKAMNGWQTLLVSVAKVAEQRLGSFMPLKAEDVGALVGSAFIGAEVNILSGNESRAFPIRRALRRIGEVIRTIEEGAQAATSKRRERGGKQ